MKKMYELSEKLAMKLENEGIEIVKENFYQVDAINFNKDILFRFILENDYKEVCWIFTSKQMNDENEEAHEIFIKNSIEDIIKFFEDGKDFEITRFRGMFLAAGFNLDNMILEENKAHELYVELKEDIELNVFKKKYKDSIIKLANMNFINIADVLYDIVK